MSISARGREGGGTQGLKRGKVKNNTRKIIITSSTVKGTISPDFIFT
jgi:hypothetical protein